MEPGSGIGLITETSTRAAAVELQSTMKLSSSMHQCTFHATIIKQVERRETNYEEEEKKHDKSVFVDI